MLEINKNKLVPGIVASWGDIIGSISKQSDLMDMLSSYATESWVEDKGYLSSVPSSYATKSWVSSNFLSATALSGYATQSWVKGQDAALFSSVESYIQAQGYVDSTYVIETVDSAISGYATQSWVSSQGFATEAWVSSQGYLTSETLPSDLATESWVSSQGFATEAWVSSQGYLTSETLPSDIATQSWVLSQSYITSDALSGYATESWVSSQQFVTSAVLSDYATQSWIESQGYIQSTNSAVVPLFSKSEGYLNYHTFSVSNIISFNYNGTQFFDNHGQVHVYTIGGEVYGINFLTPEYDEQNNPHMYIYKFNKSTMGFEHVLNNDTWVEVWGSAVTVPLISDATDAHFLWEDNQGRVYFANRFQVNLQTGEFTEVVPGSDMGGILQTYNGIVNNMFRIKRTVDGVQRTEICILYASSASKGTVYLFNETTQRFDTAGAMAGHYNKNFWRYKFVYNGNYYTAMDSTGSSVLRRMQFTGTDPSKPNVTFYIMQPAQIVMPMNFTYDGTTFHVRGDYVRQIVVDKGGSESEPELETIYIYCGDDDVRKYFQMKFDENNKAYWDPLDMYVEPGILYNRNGTECGDLLFGYGYNNNVYGAIPIWRFFGDYTAESYGWDNSVNTRLTALEEAIGDAETITQNILGV